MTNKITKAAEILCLFENAKPGMSLILDQYKLIVGGSDHQKEISCRFKEGIPGFSMVVTHKTCEELLVGDQLDSPSLRY